MDSYGVPQNINKHIIMAICQYMSKKNGLNFMQILQHVKKCNINSRKPTNLKNIVQSSLDNFQRAGVIYKDESNRYRVRCPTLLREVARIESLETNEAENNLPCKTTQHGAHFTSRKRRRNSDSFDSEDEGETVKGIGIMMQTIKKQKGKKRKYRRKLKSTPNTTMEKTLPNAIIPHNFSSHNLGSSFEKSNRFELLPPAEKVEDHRKTQKDLSFDDRSTGEPGADDRDSGDEFRVHSMASLYRTDENGETGTTFKSSTSLAEEALNGNLSNVTNVEV